MSGGQATNSGINYQQRISAWFLINQYSQFDISNYFEQIDEELIISKVYFETDHPIDDLRIACSSGRNLFLQIKRSLSLSTRETSDFYKTISQFVSEFIQSEKSNDYFTLITTSDASNKIIRDLKKLSLSINLNDASFEENPLTESEKDTMAKLEKIFEKEYEVQKEIKSTENHFIKFLKRILIGVIDIEFGNTFELSSFMLLRSIGFTNPQLIWSVLVKNSLIYATDRLSVDRLKLEAILNKHLDNEKEPSKDRLDFLTTEVISQGEYSVGKEVLLIKSFMDELDFMIIELFRFTDDCQPKSSFYSNKIKIPSGDEWTVIQRFATMAGLERFLEENPENYKNKKVAMIPANEIDFIEKSECSDLHKDYLSKLIDKNENVLLCLHCEKAITESDSHLVEIDDLDTMSAVGNVHKECLRPIDRILGLIKIPNQKNESHLDGFDFKLWVELLMKGQGMLNSMKSSPEILQGRTPLVAWNSENDYNNDFRYCIKFNLEDGSTSYAYQRSRIHRVNKIEAESSLTLFNKRFKEAKERNDPFCVLSINKTIGPYSQLVPIKKQDEEILEIVSAEISKYSKLVAKAFDRDISFYAPLCIPRDKETETIIGLGNIVPIISDPLEFSDFVKNWENLGIKFDSLELKIIKEDPDFDNTMRTIFSDGLIPIIDPKFDRNFKLVSGMPVRELNEMIQSHERDQQKKE